MDITTVIGFLAGISLMIAAVVQRSGFAGLKLFISISSVFITVGGTFAATLVNYSFHQLVDVFAIAKKVFMQKDENPLEIINTIVTLTKKARTQSMLAIEQDVKEIDRKSVV